LSASAEEVFELRPLQPVLPIQNGVNAIAERRPQPHPKQSLAQKVFAGANGDAGRMTLRNQIAAQSLANVCASIPSVLI